jgi:hypothetical protein
MKTRRDPIPSSQPLQKHNKIWIMHLMLRILWLINPITKSICEAIPSSDERQPWHSIKSRISTMGTETLSSSGNQNTTMIDDPITSNNSRRMEGWQWWPSSLIEARPRPFCSGLLHSIAYPEVRNLAFRLWQIEEENNFDFVMSCLSNIYIYKNIYKKERKKGRKEERKKEKAEHLN